MMTIMVLHLSIKWNLLMIVIGQPEFLLWIMGKLTMQVLAILIFQTKLFHMNKNIVMVQHFLMMILFVMTLNLAHQILFNQIQVMMHMLQDMKAHINIVVCQEWSTLLLHYLQKYTMVLMHGQYMPKLKLNTMNHLWRLWSNLLHLLKLLNLERIHQLQIQFQFQFQYLNQML